MTRPTGKVELTFEDSVLAHLVELERTMDDQQKLLDEIIETVADYHERVMTTIDDLYRGGYSSE